MPDAHAILEATRATAHDALGLALFWHVIVALAVASAGTGLWRPPRRQVARLLSLPLLTVAALAFRAGNPFNAAAFASLALVVLALAARISTEPIAPARGWMRSAGFAALAFGWLYPHFLEDLPRVSYLLFAPMGVVPCPTLATVIGLMLLAGGLGSRALSMLLAGAGLLYGLIGVFALGVWIDVFLFAGALALLVAGARFTSAGHAPLHGPRPS